MYNAIAEYWGSTIYYGFSNPETQTGVNDLISEDVAVVTGTYLANNPTNGYQFYLAAPSRITIKQILVDDFDCPMKELGTLTIEDETYKRYVTDGDDLGYKVGEYPFVIKTN